MTDKKGWPGVKERWLAKKLLEKQAQWAAQGISPIIQKLLSQQWMSNQRQSEQARSAANRRSYLRRTGQLKNHHRLAREQAKHLTDAQKEQARKAYKRVRDWRKDNPEKVKAQQRRQYLKRKAISEGYLHL